MTASATDAAFQLCPDIHTYNMSQVYSWVVGVMGVKFLAQGNNRSRMSQPGIESGTFRLPGRYPGNLLLPAFIFILISDINWKRQIGGTLSWRWFFFIIKRINAIIDLQNFKYIYLMVIILAETLTLHLFIVHNFYEASNLWMNPRTLLL